MIEGAVVAMAVFLAFLFAMFLFVTNNEELRQIQPEDDEATLRTSKSGMSSIPSAASNAVASNSCAGKKGTRSFTRTGAHQMGDRLPPPSQEELFVQYLFFFIFSLGMSSGEWMIRCAYGHFFPRIPIY